MAAKPARTVLTIVMDVLVLLAVCLTVGVVVRFFGGLADTGVGEQYLRFVSVITLPLGIESFKTPYGGVFDVNAAVSIGIVLLVEWALSVARRRA
ncbi:MAG: hypothetical protein ACYC77_03390 [Coriobacteriia bacterium]